MSDQHENHRARQVERRGVVWGCAIHHTPAGTECQGCLDQGELFGHVDVPRQRTWRRKRR